MLSYYNFTSPQQTYIPNDLGMSVMIYNDTDELIFILFPDYNHLEYFQPRERKYYTRDIDKQILFYISPPTTKIYNIARYVNNVVIKKAGNNFQPTFFFSTKKFVG